jgi:hypothetical protein
VSRPKDLSYKGITKRSLRFAARVVRLLVIVAGLYMVVGGALVFALPHTLILFTVVAMIWYFARTRQGKRFSLHSLFLFTAGVAVIMSIATLVPSWMLGGGAGRINKQTYIEVIDETSKPIKNAEVILTHRDEDLVVVTVYQGATNSEGVAELTCYVGGETKKSILRTWRTYNVRDWLLQAKAPGYQPASKTLSDIVVDGEGGGPINLRIELEPLKE